MQSDIGIRTYYAQVHVLQCGSSSITSRMNSRCHMSRGHSHQLQYFEQANRSTASKLSKIAIECLVGGTSSPSSRRNQDTAGPGAGASNSTHGQPNLGHGPVYPTLPTSTLSPAFNSVRSGVRGTRGDQPCTSMCFQTPAASLAPLPARNPLATYSSTSIPHLITNLQTSPRCALVRSHCTCHCLHHRLAL